MCAHNVSGCGIGCQAVRTPYPCIYYIPSPLTAHFPSVIYQPIFHTLYFTLHCARVLNNVVLTTIIEMVEILDGRVCIAFS